MWCRLFAWDARNKTLSCACCRFHGSCGFVLGAHGVRVCSHASWQTLQHRPRSSGPRGGLRRRARRRDGRFGCSSCLDFELEAVQDGVAAWRRRWERRRGAPRAAAEGGAWSTASWHYSDQLSSSDVPSPFVDVRPQRCVHVYRPTGATRTGSRAAFWNILYSSHVSRLVRTRSSTKERGAR